MKRSGLIYCLRNPSMPGLYKIGRTTKSINTRLQQLSQPTGVPTPFKLDSVQWVTDQVEAERVIHQVLSKYRLHNRREFFQLPTPDLAKICFETYAISKGIEVSHIDTIDDVVLENVPPISDIYVQSTNTLVDITKLKDIPLITPIQPVWNDEELQLLGAEYLIKIASPKHYDTCHQDLIDLQSIGIDFGITEKIIDSDKLKSGESRLTRLAIGGATLRRDEGSSQVDPPLGKRQVAMIQQFCKFPIGTGIVLGKGNQGLKYLAKITGDYQFFPDFLGTSHFPHRRSIEIIGSFKDDTLRKKSCLQTLTKLN